MWCASWNERLGLGDFIVQHLADSRRGKNTQLPLADLLRQSVYSRMAGYEVVNHAEGLSQDPAFCVIGSAKERVSCVRPGTYVVFRYLLGIALIWAPETKGKPLPED